MPRKTKDPAPVTMTHADILNSAIMYKLQQFHQYQNELDVAKTLDAPVMVAGLEPAVTRLEQELAILRTMYRYETGTEHGF